MDETSLHKAHETSPVGRCEEALKSFRVRVTRDVRGSIFCDPEPAPTGQSQAKH